MPERPCAQCGKPLPDDGRFCSHCGAVFAPSPAATLFDPAIAPAMDRASEATMFGFAAVDSRSASAAPAASSAPFAPFAPSAASARPSAGPAFPSSKQTMLGVALVPDVAALLPPVTAAAAAQPTPLAVPSAKGTMLGVAIPGIAPTSSGSTQPLPGARNAPSSTMLGVAIPGIAPVAPGSLGPPTGTAPTPALPAVPARPLPIVLPRPAPLVDEEPALGPEPRLARRGVPLAYVAGAIFALVLAFGAAVALLWKGQSLVVTPRLDAQGHEQLHLSCESCQDGTTAELDSARATFRSKEADLAVSGALRVGDNPLTIRLDRPGWGRDEDVKVVVPIAFRVKADLTGLSGARPTVVVRVEAMAGTVVRVADKLVALDAQGIGASALDVSAQTTGWADDVRLIDQAIPYVITSGAGRPPLSTAGANAGENANASEQRGSLAVRAGIATLHLDSPGIAAVMEGAKFRVAGHTVKGATVTVNGQPIPVEADGSFSHAYDARTVGSTQVEIRADAPSLASRTARFTVKRVAHLADEATQREHDPWLGYDAIVANSAASVGKATVVEGEVVDVRAAMSPVVALIADERGCSPDGVAPCLVRVVYAGEDSLVLAHGARVRAYGEVTGKVSPSSAGAKGASASASTDAVPVVRADFVVKGRAGRR